MSILALVPDFWMAEQGAVWAATVEDTEGMPRGVGMGLRSQERGQATVARMTRESDIRWEVRLAANLMF